MCFDFIFFLKNVLQTIAFSFYKKYSWEQCLKNFFGGAYTI